MSDLRTAAQQALEALKWAEEYHGGDDCYAEAITALRAALEQQAEPAWVCPESPEHRYAKPGHCEDCGKTLVLEQQAEPAPVGWLAPDGSVRKTPTPKTFKEWTWGPDAYRPLYTAPLQRKPLTDAEIVEAVRGADLDWQAGWTLDEHEPNRFTTLARAIEWAHGIGEEYVAESAST